MQKFAIIVAGGSGSRMKTEIPKQFLEVGGKPILMHTLNAFFQAEKDLRLIVVLPEKDHELWSQLCKQYNFFIQHTIVKGGSSRFQSVRNGLAAIEASTGLVAIHDGVRPFVHASVIQHSFNVAQKEGSAIAVVPLKDSIRRLEENEVSVFQDRNQFRLVQTPQTFDLTKIRQAFLVEELSVFTDDATVYEHQGWQVTLIEGNAENIKITSPDDLSYAAYLLGNRR
jgi:2-C-methyl-D-erythritol 4-phosphate cytidylyltransferase